MLSTAKMAVFFVLCKLIVDNSILFLHFLHQPVQIPASRHVLDDPHGRHEQTPARQHAKRYDDYRGDASGEKRERHQHSGKRSGDDVDVPQLRGELPPSCAIFCMYAIARSCWLSCARSA